MCIYDAETDTHGFIASDDDSVVIVFRGTDSFTNALTDVQFIKEPIFEGQLYLAHGGFLDAFKKVYKSTVAHVKPVKRRYILLGIALVEPWHHS